MSANNFDGVALIYDSLSHIFFGKSLRNAQTYFFKKIPVDSKILVLGSGSGWIADELLVYNNNLKITLVDASKKMTELARNRLREKPVEIFQTDESKLFSNPFDVVILPFFLDLFPNQKLSHVIQSIKKNATDKCTWLIIDFVSKNWWQRFYLWTMYRFFRWTCNIEAYKLPDWQSALAANKIEIQETKSFYMGFIESTVCVEKSLIESI